MTAEIMERDRWTVWEVLVDCELPEQRERRMVGKPCPTCGQPASKEGVAR